MQTPPNQPNDPAQPPLAYRAVTSDAEDAERRRRRAARSWDELFGGVTALFFAVSIGGISILILVRSIFSDGGGIEWVGVSVAVVVGLFAGIAGHRAWEMLWAPRYRGRLPAAEPGVAVAVPHHRPAGSRSGQPVKRTVFTPLPTGYAAPSPESQKKIVRANRRFRRRMFVDRLGNGIFAAAAIVVLGFAALATRPGFWVWLARFFARLH